MKKRHTLKWSTLGIVLILLCMHYSSCTDDNKDSIISEKDVPPRLVEIKDFLRNKTLYTIDLDKTFSCQKQIFTYVCAKNSLGKLEPDWSTLQTYQDEENDVQTLMLKSKSTVSGLTYTRSKGKEKAQINVATFKLVIWKIEGALVGRIMTYLPDNRFYKDSLNCISKLGYELENTNYSGIRLVSTLDGMFLYGDKYEKGQHLFHFLPTETYRKSISKKDSTKSSITRSNLTEDHIFLKFISERCKLETRSVYTTQESGDFYCSFCGRPANQCTCITVTPPKVYCPRCGMETKYCLCCNRCHNYPCKCCKSCFHYPCICCNICHHYPCTCYSTGGGGSSGSGNPGSGSTPQGSHKKTAAIIKSVTESAVRKVLNDHNNDKITAHCNEGVRNAFEKLFKSNILDNMNANTMTKYWINNPKQWEPIQMSKAQNLANEGYFVVAGYINPTGSGHVVVIVPGTETLGNWNGTRTYLPNTMDTGSRMRSTSQPINRSFGKSKHNKVIFFKYK
ncbi:hypothetical protein [Bacteroides thetaiotaomicron]|uniref:hypothetical protein n=1 Tax=Bacteroides thetaiotaomicron TaxID=818 RepID=UPI001F450E29|nr:hypothetical protein [Bacteroides thetaiotaomicron]